MRRGQLTLIIIAMLLVLIIVGIILYAARSVTTKRGEERVETQQRTAALLKPVQDYVAQCLDLSARSIIELLGTQGGHIYASQGGITPDPLALGTDYVLDGTTKVSYAILPPQGNVGTLFYAKPPEYPWPTFPVLYNETGALLFDSYLQGYYGRNQLPQLEGQGSLQEELEVSVLAKTQTCVDWTVFQKQGIDVQTGQPSLRVVFGARGTSFLLYYPMNLTSVVTNTEARADSFAIELPVRMKAIHQLAHYVVDKEVTNISFDPSSLVLDNVAVSTARNVNAQDDILKFIDPSSRLGGVQYVFQVARKNRVPAIVWVKDSDVASVKLCDSSVISSDAEHVSGDVSSCNNIDGSFNGFSWTMQAYDPDEDNATFRYYVGPSRDLTPYTVTLNDASFAQVQLIVEASDSQFTVPETIDSQTILIPVGVNP
jgi:hypothetical protein